VRAAWQLYTSSWIAPKADVHSQQRFFYMGHTGEVTVDQAHRWYGTMSIRALDLGTDLNRHGQWCARYNVANDGSGFATVNPLFMKYEPTNGKFSGQQGYGYRSFENFIDAVTSINAGELTVGECDTMGLATIGTTVQTTAILEAGRRSLDSSVRPLHTCLSAVACLLACLPWSNGR
jgi:D-galacturonate reductase